MQNSNRTQKKALRRAASGLHYDFAYACLPILNPAQVVELSRHGQFEDKLVRLWRSVVGSEISGTPSCHHVTDDETEAVLILLPDARYVPEATAVAIIRRRHPGAGLPQYRFFTAEVTWRFGETRGYYLGEGGIGSALHITYRPTTRERFLADAVAASGRPPFAGVCAWSRLYR